MNVHTMVFLMAAALPGVVTPGYAEEHARTDPARSAPAQADVAPSAEEVRQKLGSAVDAIKSYSADKRDEAAQKAEAALDALDLRMDLLEKEIDRNWEKMDLAARERARRALSALQDERVKVAEWYGSLKSSTASAWEETRQGFVKAYQSLQRDWENAEREQAKNETTK
jgi:hypothetical protein